MAIIELSSLVRPVTRADALADLITLAQSMNFSATSWRIGSESRFWLVSLAECVYRLSNQVALTATQGFNDLSFGNGLVKFARSRYDNTQIAAIKTQGGVVLTDDGNVGPITIGIGERVFVFDSDPSITYRNITGGTLPLGGTLALTVEAETGGRSHNVAIDTITEMNPTIAGVSVTNPANPTDWITREGVDTEADPSLRTRNRAKWSTLGGNAPAGAYEFWALTATDGSGNPVGITRVYVDDNNPGGPGTVYVYIADSYGTASAPQVADVQTYINARKPRTANVTVLAATPKYVTVAGTFHVPTGYGATRKTEIEADVTAYLNSLDIGGEDIGETFGRVLTSAIIEVAMAPDLVKRVALTSPASDVIILPQEVVVPTSVAFTATEI